MKRVLNIALTLMLLSAAGLTGCVQRTIKITSTPAGALVHLNDEEVGRTPVEVPYLYYGTYDVRLQLDGYQPLWTQAEAKAPWWEAPGPDLIAEAVSDAEVKQEWHYDLEVQPLVDEKPLVERAKEMQMRLNEPEKFEALEAAAEDETSEEAGEEITVPAPDME